MLEKTDIEVGAFSGTTEVDFGGGVTVNTDADPDADPVVLEADHPGAWQGAFYGAGEELTDAPGTAVGTFDAVTDGAAVIGGFGATLQ